MIIDQIWQRQSGDFFFLCTKSSSKKWEEHAFKRGQRIQKFLEANSDKDIYFCPHGFKKPRDGNPSRTKSNAIAPNMLWADLDEVDPRKLEGCLRPTMAWESSPGRFVGIWITNRVVDEELNRRLTYHLGADKGGWDFTQVLRIPGTVNHKYASMPKVRLLWDDGDEVSVDELERVLPNDVKISSSMTSADVYRQYEKSMPPWLRKELLHGKPEVGKRSEVLYKIENTLIELGCSLEEVFVLIKASPWNKFKGRTNEDEQLTRELDKIINKKSAAEGAEKKQEYKFLQRSLSEIEEANIDWIWYPYLARGELTILEGDPEAGKSYLAMMVSKAICDGDKLPSKKPKVVTGKVAYFDMENDPGTITKKRMMYNGIRNMSAFYPDDEPFTIDDEKKWDAVQDAVEHLKPALVVFDTLNTYIGKADTYKANDSQQAMAKFSDIGKRFGCAVLVLRHLNKAAKGPAMYRGQGSIALAGFARVVMTVGRVPSEKTEIEGLKAVTVTKLNIARKPRALTYTIDSLPDTLKDEDRSKFTWHDEMDLTSDEMLSEDNINVSGDGKLDQTMEWVKDALIDGPKDAAVIEQMAKTRECSVTTLNRACQKLEIVKRKEGFKGKWVWALPD